MLLLAIRVRVGVNDAAYLVLGLATCKMQIVATCKMLLGLVMLVLAVRVSDIRFSVIRVRVAYLVLGLDINLG